MTNLANDILKAADLVNTALQAVHVGSLCPGCSGAGAATADPQVLRCSGCGGVFTVEGLLPITEAQALAFVAFNQPMLANAGPEGSFYFDLAVRSGVYPDCRDGRRRMHGWADRKTKRVVQWG